MRYLIVILLIVLAGDCYGKPNKFPQNNSHAGGGHQKSHHSSNPIINIDNRSLPRPVQARGGEGVPRGNTTTNTHINENNPASTPAFVSPGDCQSGSSATGHDGGIALVTRNPLCDYWDAAEVALKAYQLEEVNATCKPTSCVVNCSMDGYVEAELITCTDTPLGQKYLADYHHNLDMAQELIDSSVVGDKVDRQVSAWSKVLFWLAIVVWLA
jgi:hypothetical protein